MELDKPGVGNSSTDAGDINELDSLKSQLDEFIEKEKLDLKSSAHPESSQDKQQRLDEFVEALQHQMDAFVEEASEPTKSVAPIPLEKSVPFSADRSSALEVANSTVEHRASDNMLISPVLIGTLFVIAALLWFVWPDSMIHSPEHQQVQRELAPEMASEAIEVAEPVMPEEFMQEVLKPAAEPVDILLPELVVVVDVANMRRKPSTRSQIVMKLKQGDLVSLLEQQGDWFKVQLPDNSHAWAFKSIVAQKKETALQLEAAKPEQAEISPEDMSAKLTVAVKTGIIRSLPSTSSDVVLKLKQGAVLTQIKREGDWLKVQLSGGRIAWAHHSIF